MCTLEATHGSVVTISYTLTLDDGAVIGERNHRLEYLHGWHNIVPGLETALEGMKPGERRAVVLEPAEAYGDYNADGLITMPIGSVPADVQLEPGAQIRAKTARGPVTLTVTEVRSDSVVFDTNHPLAGKRLHFDVEAMNIRTAIGRELRQGYPGTECNDVSCC
jgi:FKBP-type peptidyl-prolyl cis-trans isomerase SlyD